MNKGMKFNFDIKQIGDIVKNILGKVQRYTVFLSAIGILLVYSFLVLRVSTLSQAEPNEDQIAEQANTVKRLRIDQNSIDKIEQLEDQNIAVQALFQDARNNPFRD